MSIDPPKNLPKPTIHLLFRGNLGFYTEEQATAAYRHIKDFVNQYAYPNQFSGDIIKQLDPCCGEKGTKNANTDPLPKT